MKFDAEDPAEVTDNKQQDKVDRSQGAARAISVSGSAIEMLVHLAEHASYDSLSLTQPLIGKTCPGSRL